MVAWRFSVMLCLLAGALSVDALILMKFPEATVFINKRRAGSL